MRKSVRSLGPMQCSVSAYLWDAASADIRLFELEEELAAALYQLEAAKSRLSQVERRFAGLLNNVLALEFPASYVAAEEAEGAAVALVEGLKGEIASARAHTKAGLALKFRLLAMFYSEDVGDVANLVDSSDPSEELLRSVLAD